MDSASDIHPENSDSKLTSSSPSTHSEMSTDGDASLTHSAISSNEKVVPMPDTNDQVTAEPKTKKRRKQSKPLKCQSTLASATDLPIDDDIDLSKVNDHEFHSSEKSEKTAVVEPSPLNPSNSESSDFDNSISSMVTENISQKNILSHMNSIYNSGKVHGKEASTQGDSRVKNSVTTSESNIIKNDDMQMNMDCTKLFQNFYPQMPPLVPLNPTDFAGELSKLTNVFSHLAELPTQLSQPGFNVTPSNRSFVTSNGIRIFNPEAYCELCEKEFCNKYFLKTHKANKHGVCSVDSSSVLQRAQLKSSLNVSSQVHSQVTNSHVSENSPHSTSDAYCNICQKSFCNKYFLKKHRQNIHGIVENGTSEPSTNVPSSIHVPVISSSSRSMASDSKPEEASSDHSGNEDQKNILGGLKHKVNGNSSSTFLNGFNSTPLGKSKTLLPGKQARESKSERYLCSLCNIEFCDKHYLDTHKQNKHGVDVPSSKVGQEFAEFSEVGKMEVAEKLLRKISDSEDFKGQMCVPCMKTFSNSEAFHVHMLEVHGAAVKDENKEKHVQVQSSESSRNALLHDSDNSNSSDSNMLHCSLCFMKFKDRSTLLLHFDSCHVKESLNIANGMIDKKDILPGSSLYALRAVSGFSCDACPETFTEKSLLIAHRLKAHGIISPVPEPPGADGQGSRGFETDYSFLLGEKQRSSSSQSFCRICNKELCNKYFMKTHMLKMHGIDMESVQPERPTQSKSSSGACCDICQKVLCNRYFLKVHKLNVHGVTDESSKPDAVPESGHSSTAPEAGVSRSMDLRSAPVANAASVSEGNSFLRQSTASAQSASKDYAFSCEVCGQLFQSKVQLQVHLVGKHAGSGEVRAADFASLVGLAAGKTESLTTGSLLSAKQNGSGAERKKTETPCSCCSFIKIEEKPHGVPQFSTERMLLCHICNTSYHLSDHIHHHLAHNKLLPPELRPSTNDSQSASSQAATCEVPLEPDSKLKPKQRKFKRFRCSKCDKTFRTRNRCLRHIHAMHKNKKEPMNLSSVQQSAAGEHGAPSPKKAVPDDSHASSSPGDKPEAPKDFAVGEKNCFLGSDFQQSPPLAVPYVMPKTSQDIIMQPFHLSEPKADGYSSQNVFVPSLVYLPVSKKVSEPITVAFTLTPA